MEKSKQPELGNVHWALQVPRLRKCAVVAPLLASFQNQRAGKSNPCNIAGVALVHPVVYTEGFLIIRLEQGPLKVKSFL